MAIQHLTDEQVRTWTLEQKDRWWLQNVWKGDMPQLTLRAGITGFMLGGVLSATNLYVGAKTGWTLGVGITSVILAFAIFRLLSRLGLRDLTILENNCSQSIATAAGYMTGPLISGIAAYMFVQNQVLPWWQIMWFNLVLSIVGVLVAFPMKRRFINDEQQPFPEGRACGVVLDTLHSSDASVGMRKARMLGIAAGVAAGLKFLAGENLMRYLQVKLLGLKDFWHLREHVDEWFIWVWVKLGLPELSAKLWGLVDYRQLGLQPSMDLALVGAGGLMGIRAASSLLLGMFINFVVIVPWMIAIGEIAPKSGSFETGDATFTRIHVVNNWALWWGIAIMVTAAMTSLFAKPKMIIQAFTGFLRKKDPAARDVLGHIELPLWVSLVGVPLVGAVGVWMAHEWFGVGWVFGASAIPLIIVLTLIAANSTALTGITPTGSLSKIPQFLFGSLDPKHPPTNLMTGVMCVEVASNASNLLMDIKPGYMLGAKPRQQAIGHCIGVIAGALASTPLFFWLFLPHWDPSRPLMDQMLTNQFSFPAAMQWKGVSDLVTSVFDRGKTPIPNSAVVSMLVAVVVGLIMEIWRIVSRGKFPISPLAVGLGVVITPDSTMAMFFGAFFFWIMLRRFGSRPESTGYRRWVDNQEPICAGLIAGASLLGIADQLVRAFLL